MSDYSDFFFDDAIGGSEGGYSGDYSNYDSAYIPEQYYQGFDSDNYGSLMALGGYNPEAQQIFDDWGSPAQQLPSQPQENFVYQMASPQQVADTGRPSLWDLMQQAGSALQSPGGKFGAGLIGAGISAYGANKANKNSKKAFKQQQQMLAARQAKQAQYDSPLRLANARQQLAAPQQRAGEAQWFSNNRLPSYFADGGGVSEDDWMRMQEEARQGTLDARMDRPSMMGFLRYLAAGKRMPSELAAAKRAQKPNNVIDVIQTRNQALRDAAGMGDAPVVVERAAGGPLRYVKGGTSGQSDKIPAMLSDGEYVVDADVVSALGDGNNEAGAKKLDGMRHAVRAHKRSAPANSIPPKAKAPEQYLKGKK